MKLYARYVTVSDFDDQDFAVSFGNEHPAADYDPDAPMRPYVLGVSSVVVLLSLLFWGWLLGPIGLSLSVPLTMALAVALDTSPHSRPLAILLGSDTARPEASSQ